MAGLALVAPLSVTRGIERIIGPVTIQCVLFIGLYADPPDLPGWEPGADVPIPLPELEEEER